MTRGLREHVPRRFKELRDGTANANDRADVWLAAKQCLDVSREESLG